MRFVNNHQIKIVPVDGRQIEIARPAAVAAQIGVGQHRVAKAIFEERIERTVVLRLIHRPVVAQLLGTQDEDSGIQQLKVFDHREGLKGLAQAHAIGDDAAIVLPYFVDRVLCAIPLKFKQGLPYLRIDELLGSAEQAAGFLLRQKPLKEVKQGFVVDKFRRVILIELR